MYIKNKAIYFNWACIAPPASELIRAENYFINIQRELPFKPKENYKILKNAVRESRTQISEILNYPDPQSVLFYTGTSHAFQQIYCLPSMKDFKQIITTDSEFISFYNLFEAMEKELMMIPIMELKSKEQIISNLDTLLKLNAKVVFFSHVAYNSGAIMPIMEMIDIIKLRSPEALIIVDGTQAVGQIAVDLSKMKVDAYIFGCNKWLLGPDTGVAVVINKHLRQDLVRNALSPFMVDDSFSHGKMSRSGLSVSAVSALKYVLHPFLPFGKIFSLQKKISNLRESFLLKNEKAFSNLQLVCTYLKSSGIVSLDVSTISDYDMRKIWKTLTKSGVYAYYINENNNNVKAIPKRRIMRFSLHSLNTEDEIERSAPIINSVFSSVCKGM